MLYFISGPEIFFVFLVILLVFGADRVPEIARNLGKGMRQVKNATQDIKSEIQHSANDEAKSNIKNKISEVQKEIEEVGGTIKRNL